MAVVSISRIQVRRGKANSGTGFPQLASGEVGWAIDTQELYIGNGSVSEGSPRVGNTRILTQQDLDNFNQTEFNDIYVYKANDPSITTGLTPELPVYRTLRTKLDDFATAFDFGAFNNGITDTTFAIQHAIDQLYLNETASAVADPTRRRVFELPAGTYLISNTIVVPSYTTIIGAGADKTTLLFAGPLDVFRFINDTSIGGFPSELVSSLVSNQPKNIVIEGLSISMISPGIDRGLWDSGTTYIISNIVSYNSIMYIAILGGMSNTPIAGSDYWTLFKQVGLQMDAVRDSTFKNIVINGNYDYKSELSHIGIKMNAVSSMVTCKNNQFNNVSFNSIGCAVRSSQDIIYNTFDNCSVTDVHIGIEFDNAEAGLYGPRYTLINNCKFTDVIEYAILIDAGFGNTIENCNLVNVGEVYSNSQILINSVGNSVRNIISDRTAILSSIGGIYQVELTLSGPITAAKDSIIEQPSSGAFGLLLNAADNNNIIQVYTLYGGDFTPVYDIHVNGDPSPGDGNITVQPTNVSAPYYGDFIPYVAEVYGNVLYPSYGISKLMLDGYTEGFTSGFRLPICGSQCNYTINYLCTMTGGGSITRRGMLYVMINMTGTPSITSFDDFEYEEQNHTCSTISTELRFNAVFEDQNGSTFLDNPGQIVSDIVIQYYNPDNIGDFTYYYSVLAQSAVDYGG
jgi:hypothetical protein